MFEEVDSDRDRKRRVAAELSSSIYTPEGTKCQIYQDVRNMSIVVALYLAKTVGLYKQRAS